MQSTTSDPSFYIEGAKRMVAEGLETVSKISAYARSHSDELDLLSESERKAKLLEFEPAQLFNQVHPIVFQYLASEGVFNPHAFRRYVLAVFGKPKSKEDEAAMRKDRKSLYHFKNAQHALYYKYLLIETNPNVSKTTIHAMYEEVVKTLNNDTDNMIDKYERAQEETTHIEEQMTAEKRRELVDLLRKRM